MYTCSDVSNLPTTIDTTNQTIPTITTALEMWSPPAVPVPLTQQLPLLPLCEEAERERGHVHVSAGLLLWGRKVTQSPPGWGRGMQLRGNWIEATGRAAASNAARNVGSSLSWLLLPNLRSTQNFSFRFSCTYGGTRGGTLRVARLLGIRARVADLPRGSF